MKWKRPNSVKESINMEAMPSSSTVAPVSGPLTDDQQLTVYQNSKKKAEQELMTL